MGFQPHYLPDFFVAGLCMVLSVVLWRWARELPARKRRWTRVLLVSTVILVCITALLATVRIARLFPSEPTTWVRCVGMFVGAGLVYGFLLTAGVRFGGRVQPARRGFLKVAAGAAVAAPAALAGFAIIKRDDLVFREVEVRLPSITPDLDGLRLVQLSDMHLSPFVSERLLARAVGMANEAKPHLAFITGDLISLKGDPLDTCLDHLRMVRAEAGVFGCMGNHEIYAQSQEYTQREAARFGARFLRSESARLQFGNTPFVISGVDYQRRGRKYLDGTERLVVPGAFNLLLSHNPDVFPVAAGQKFDLTLAGHTHGGQVNFEMIHPSLNIVRFVTPFIYGLYENSGRGLYVTRGIGTIGVPARLGAPPEVALIRLCATSS